MSGVSKHTSCREIFKDYNTLTVPCLYILDIVYYIRKYKQSGKNAQIHKYDTRRRLYLYVYFCNRDLFRESAINRGIRFDNKVPDYIKKSDKDIALKRKLRFFLLQQALCLVDEYVSF